MPESTSMYMLEDLSHELDNPRLHVVLAPAVYRPTPARLAAICDRYRSEWMLLGFRSNDAIIGCIGLELGSAGRATIRHIAVAPDRRRAGIGTALIRQVCATFALTQLSAETDRDAVGFYGKCGFAARSLGEKYPGTERFLCTYTVE